ncbi:hypothetical protein ElyMa_001067800 [Elysia marginata]|uniref:Uncharacterized protein n=1 Tax=Elysia marginata TaxID=1093978 RepID=A0AAV4HQU3_9GAST|nr:hypothetical protein ElyMa_001067800 [Elysia marginata]
MDQHASLVYLEIRTFAPSPLPLSEDLIHHEVLYLYSNDHDMTVDHCTTKCDALFDLIAGHDEAWTDKMCHYECSCQKNNNCHRVTAPHNHRTTTAPPPRTTQQA